MAQLYWQSGATDCMPINGPFIGNWGETRECGLAATMVYRLPLNSPDRTHARRSLVVSRDAQILPLFVESKNLESMLLGSVVSVTSKQQSQWRIGQRCDMQKRRCRFHRVPRLLAIVIPLKADCSADCCIVLRPAYAKLRGRARKVGSKAARFDDGDFYAERPDLFGQRRST